MKTIDTSNILYDTGVLSHTTSTYTVTDSLVLIAFNIGSYSAQVGWYIKINNVPLCYEDSRYGQAYTGTIYLKKGDTFSCGSGGYRFKVYGVH